MTALLSLVVGTAAADPPTHGLPVAAAGRGLTLERLAVAIGVEPGVVRADEGVGLTVALPLRVGLSDDLELFAAPVVQSVGPVLHEPAMGALLRLVDGPVEVGLRGAVDLGLFGDPKQATVLPGLPLRLHPADPLAIDLGVSAMVRVLPETALGVFAPAGATVSVTDAVFVTASSGLRVADLADPIVGAPLAGMVGATIGRDGKARVDLGARAGWDEVRVPDAFSVVASVRLYFVAPR